MTSVNKAIIIGRAGADPEKRNGPSGDVICNIRVATSESWKDKNTGDKKETTEWHRVVLYRKLGEVASEYVRKGSQVYIEGKIKTRKWKNKKAEQILRLQKMTFDYFNFSQITNTVTDLAENRFDKTTDLYLMMQGICDNKRNCQC